MKTTNEQVGYSPLTTDQANQDFCAYYEKAPVYSNKIKAIVLNMDQVNAIKDLDEYFRERDIACTGFRIYKGVNTEDPTEPPTPISILVGMDENGKDITEHNGITCIKGCDGAARTWGVCPDMCDEESPITQE